MGVENPDARRFYEIEAAKENWDDRCVKMEFEKPTIGILLCDKKDDAIVEMTLPDNENIYATEYKLYLPDAALLRQKLREWIQEATESHPMDNQ